MDSAKSHSFPWPRSTMKARWARTSQALEWAFFLVRSTTQVSRHKYCLKARANGRNIVGQQHPTMLGVVNSCCVRLHGPLRIILRIKNYTKDTVDLPYAGIDRSSLKLSFTFAYMTLNKFERKNKAQFDRKFGTSKLASTFIFVWVKLEQQIIKYWSSDILIACEQAHMSLFAGYWYIWCILMYMLADGVWTVHGVYYYY